MSGARIPVAPGISRRGRNPVRPQVRGNFWQPVDKRRERGRIIDPCHSRLQPTQTGSCPRIPARAALRATLLARVQDLPIISPHGHVDAAVIEHNTPFPDPAALLVSPDHYVTRLIHASGVSLDKLRGSGSATPDPAQVWREFCTAWPLLRGHRLRLLAAQPVPQRLRPRAGDLAPRAADASYDAISARLAGTRLPAAPAVQGLQHRGPGHHGRPPGRPRQPQGDRRRTPASTAGSLPDLPPGRLPEHRASRLDRQRRPADRRRRRRRHRLCRLHHGPGEPAPLLRGARRGLRRPRRAGRPPP